jgi:hypothetical protein
MQNISSGRMETHIRNELKDPDAAKIRNLSRVCFIAAEQRISTDRPLSSYCGWLWQAEVNGKNGFGAYVGYKDEYYISTVAMKGQKTGFYLREMILPEAPNLFSSSESWDYRVCK